MADHQIAYKVQGDGTDFEEKKAAVKDAILALLDCQIAGMVREGIHESEPGAVQFSILARMGMNFEFRMAFPDIIAGKAEGEHEVQFHLDHTGAYVEREQARQRAKMN